MTVFGLPYGVHDGTPIFLAIKLYLNIIAKSIGEQSYNIFFQGFVIILFYCLMDRQVAEIVRPEQQSFVEEEAQHDPLIVYVTRRPPASEPSMSSIDDPLYERVKKPGEEEPIIAEKEQKPQEEPVYAKVHKDEDEDVDPFPVVTPGSPRFLRGLTRLEVIRMAKKSDADRKVLKNYESPKGSRDDLAEHPLYMSNQQELDEELHHFRTFFAEGKESSPRPSTSSKTPPGTPTPSPLPRTSSSTSSTTVVKTSIRKKTSNSFGKTDGSPAKHSVVSYESYERHETSRYVTALPDSDTPPALPPRAPDLLDDDDFDDQKDSEAKAQLLDVERDDESLTDVSAADDLDKDSDDDEESQLLDGSRPTEVVSLINSLQLDHLP
ncbi:hypothetical protein QZH41_002061 [Actinostola sp. cb2023]|nr:hypothetical protein QZH41_002061 [Actinostola sp. cb2023]